MNQSLCPLCGSPGCTEGAARFGPAAVRYGCQTHCGPFRMGAGFLKSVWPAMTNDDKSAIAAYMRATKGARSFLPLLHAGNYMKYVTTGRTR
jgi:hypothetical protein